MKLSEIAEMIDTIGIPFTYDQWAEDEAPDLPYIAYYYPRTRGEYADDQNFIQINGLNIELYTEHKNFELENQIIRMLNENMIPFDSSEQYLTSEKMYEVLFECEIPIEEEEED